ncbi:alpha/beta hydrolase, partial [Acinetobacter baumannii]
PMAFFLGLILLLALVIAGLVFFTSSTAKKVEALLPPRGQFMDIDGQRIQYTDSGGTKPAVVMIHGLGGNMLHFGYAMADKLANDF